MPRSRCLHRTSPRREGLVLVGEGEGGAGGWKEAARDCAINRISHSITALKGNFSGQEGDFSGERGSLCCFNIRLGINCFPGHFATHLNAYWRNLSPTHPCHTSASARAVRLKQELRTNSLPGQGCGLAYGRGASSDRGYKALIGPTRQNG
ncbi:hypothetical protein E2C01_019555 [Portunus trituberculatus]|uniref:Uncharacterized protein n=1 Tax=Portunus trituberculatus TaxID=210409 RepID=A0A5B7DZP3_PORTR|nr:hypothetical protein [Portunus trituberculatus]